MSSVKAERAVGTQLYGQTKKEPAKGSEGPAKAPPSKAPSKKAPQKPQEKKKKGKGGKGAAKH